jgi:enoyl-CoA hydratase/carnithine racemase
VPTIAAISGACTGGGAAIACCCDLRIAATNAMFGYPVARTLGNCISLANYARFSDLVGPARVKDMIFLARLVDAQEALSIGLVTEVVAPHQLMQRADEMATLVTSHAPLTLQVTKQALLRLRQRISSDDLGRDLILTCYSSDDFREGVDAFLNKKKPRWKGR